MQSRRSRRFFARHPTEHAQQSTSRHRAMFIARHALEQPRSQAEVSVYSWAGLKFEGELAEVVKLPGQSARRNNVDSKTGTQPVRRWVCKQRNVKELRNKIVSEDRNGLNQTWAPSDTSLAHRLLDLKAFQSNTRQLHVILLTFHRVRSGRFPLQRGQLQNHQRHGTTEKSPPRLHGNSTTPPAVPRREGPA